MESAHVPSRERTRSGGPYGCVQLVNILVLEADLIGCHVLTQTLEIWRSGFLFFNTNLFGCFVECRILLLVVACELLVVACDLLVATCGV